jgi:membrane peptidoglycan carboxypeptidase
MMKVYGTMANKGYINEPTTVLKIEDRNGKVIYDHEKIMKNKKPLQVLDSTTAYTMTRMMQNVIVYGTANTLKSQYCKHCDFAGKTGTTQNHSDGWFVGYNPNLVTGVWVGGPSPAVRFRSMNYGRGAALAMPIVGNFWYQLSIDPKFAKLTQEEFVKNEKIISEMSCPLRLGYSPDKYYAVMRDSTLRDSMMRTGFRGLNSIVKEMFPEEAEQGESTEGVDGEGGEIAPTEGGDGTAKESTPKPNGDKLKPDNKPTDPKLTDPKKPATTPDPKKPAATDPKKSTPIDPKAKKAGGGK